MSESTDSASGRGQRGESGKLGGKRDGKRRAIAAGRRHAAVFYEGMDVAVTNDRWERRKVTVTGGGMDVTRPGKGMVPSCRGGGDMTPAGDEKAGGSRR